MHLQQILKDSETRLADIAKNQEKYKPLMEKLLVQGLLSLLETKVTLRVRKQDVGVLKVNAAITYNVVVN